MEFYQQFFDGKPHFRLRQWCVMSPVYDLAFVDVCECGGSGPGHCWNKKLHKVSKIIKIKQTILFIGGKHSSAIFTYWIIPFLPRDIWLHIQFFFSCWLGLALPPTTTTSFRAIFRVLLCIFTFRPPPRSTFLIFPCSQIRAQHPLVRFDSATDSALWPCGI